MSEEEFKKEFIKKLMAHVMVSSSTVEKASPFYLLGIGLLIKELQERGGDRTAHLKGVADGAVEVISKISAAMAELCESGIAIQKFTSENEEVGSAVIDAGCQCSDCKAKMAGEEMAVAE